MIEVMALRGACGHMNAGQREGRSWVLNNNSVPEQFRTRVPNSVYCSAAGYRITYSVVTLSYDNYYANLRDYSNFLLSDLL